ncbi:hypothetical protein ULMS_19330 [Patiriisocius marinistellae]|uniref:Uncharacterized protein n=1 Tax=Patiriisocius marinistellae TaxID=2494560 RepID=A0A5J4G1R5_9FLAO|nr:hypothetical protein [Patiriisocius marinistellae]GEQ86425.1 hypothetical protein ULMS_19330 [Patiriisocius marinistellae]
MSNLLKKPKKEHPKDKQAKYESLNLIENPFPNTPFVNKENEDNRYNGRIYEAKVREKEHHKIIENFIKVPQVDQNHIRLGYILDHSYVGRGNGKSAFALNLINEINEEYCLNISNELNKCFGLHLSPEPGGRTKTFFSFVDLIFDAIIQKGIINYCLASLRLASINEIKKDITFDDLDENEIVEQLNNLYWFQQNDVEIAEVTKGYYEHEKLDKISSSFPLNRDKNTFYNNVLVTQKDFKKYYYEVLKKGKERMNFVFNDLVLFFQAAGFNGAYFIVDDFERIPDFQSEKLKQEFALELRTNFFDGILENAKIGFYNLILILHAGVPRLVEKAWGVSGMHRRSPMSEDEAEHIVKFDKLSYEHTKLMLEKYLEEYRLNKLPESSIAPFTEDAIKIIGEKSEMNASTILEKAYSLIESAVRDEVSKIDGEYVQTKLGKKDEETKEDINDILDGTSEDLFKKSKEK